MERRTQSGKSEHDLIARLPWKLRGLGFYGYGLTMTCFPQLRVSTGWEMQGSEKYRGAHLLIVRRAVYIAYLKPHHLRPTGRHTLQQLTKHIETNRPGFQVRFFSQVPSRFVLDFGFDILGLSTMYPNLQQARVAKSSIPI
jgi:hypothetical protein